MKLKPFVPQFFLCNDPPIGIVTNRVGVGESLPPVNVFRERGAPCVSLRRQFVEVSCEEYEAAHKESCYEGGEWCRNAE